MRTLDRVFLWWGVLMAVAFVALVLVFPHTPWAR
jgi:hypothetical protein